MVIRRIFDNPAGDSQQLGKGHISILRLAVYLRTRQPDVRCWVSHGGGSVPSSIPTPAVHLDHPSLFGMPIERAWINYLLLSFGKFRLRSQRAPSGSLSRCF